MEKEPILIGAKERLRVIDSHRDKVVARIDTGATTSSIHCLRHWFVKKDGVKHLCFLVLNENAYVLKTQYYKKRIVKSSNGHTQTRYSVKLDVLIGGMIFNTEFTLTDRTHMKHKILIGRSFLEGNFIVDVSKKYILK